MPLNWVYCKKVPTCSQVTLLLWAMAALLHMHYTKVKCVVVAAWQMHFLGIHTLIFYGTVQINNKPHHHTTNHITTNNIKLPQPVAWHSIASDLICRTAVRLDPVAKHLNKNVLLTTQKWQTRTVQRNSMNTNNDRQTTEQNQGFKHTGLHRITRHR